MALAMVGGLYGCGGPDFTSGVRGGAYDTGLSGGYGGYGSGLQGDRQRRPDPAAVTGVFPMQEVSFEIADLAGNPFDYMENDIQVAITKPDQKVQRIPAFFDGGQTWRARYTPDQQGRHSVTQVTRNGRPTEPEKLQPRDFEVAGKALPGFVRTDPRDRTRFAHANGAAYYPIGINVAWGDVVPILGKLGKAGGNWSRVWMCHWGGANLDWVMGKKIEEGTLDLTVARKWDGIVQAAEQAGVYIQMVLQHHGQYSTGVNPNWSENPWNKQAGGFLATPGEFFVSPRAIALTRAKYRYIVARWGYSPNVMAWELFNEVEWTDAIANKHADEVAAWHEGMAKFIRGHDAYAHLVTTSSSLDIPGLYTAMSYLQPHAYPPDALAVTGAFDGRKLDRPVFYGEIGPAGLRDDGSFFRRSLWSSLASMTAGAAQYWAWDLVDSKDWYALLTPAVAFARESGFTSRRGLSPAPVTVTTSEQGPLTLRPGGGWATAKPVDFTVPPGSGGAGAAWSSVPSYLHGAAHRQMFPSMRLRVTFAKPGKVRVGIAQVARAGAQLIIGVDGKPAAEKSYPAGERDRTVADTVEAPVPEGEHTVTIENAGADWVVVSGVTLDPYAPALGAMGKTGSDFGILWLYNRAGSPVSGKLAVSGIQSGDYEVVWFDTQTGKAQKREAVMVKPKAALMLTTPPVQTDMAVHFVRTRPGADARAALPRTGSRRPGSGSAPAAIPAPGAGKSDLPAETSRGR
jgi:hypothetical protein